MTKVQQEPLIGQVFHDLTVLEVVQIGRIGKKVKAVCKCGVIKDYYLNNLRRPNHTTSCGCNKIAKYGDGARTHGLSKHPLYGVWCTMKERCGYSKHKDYERYGGSGVSVCDEWVNDFIPFYNWAIKNGWEHGKQVDKDAKAIEAGITPLIYSPEWCSIVTVKQNQNSRKDNIIVEYNGQKNTVSELATKYSVKYHMLWTRIVKYKWDVHKAIITPCKQFKTNGRPKRTTY